MTTTPIQILIERLEERQEQHNNLHFAYQKSTDPDKQDDARRCAVQANEINAVFALIARCFGPDAFIKSQEKLR